MGDSEGRLYPVQQPQEHKTSVSRACRLLPFYRNSQKSFDFDASGNIIAVQQTELAGDRLCLTDPTGKQLPDKDSVLTQGLVCCQHRHCLNIANFAWHPNEQGVFCLVHASAGMSLCVDRVEFVDVRVHPNGSVMALDGLSGSLHVYGVMPKMGSE